MPKRRAVTSINDSGDLHDGDAVISGTGKPPAKKPRTSANSQGSGVVVSNGNPKRSTRAQRQKKQPKQEQEIDPRPTRKSSPKRPLKAVDGSDGETPFEEDEDRVKDKVKRKRKTKATSQADQMPIAARTAGHRLFIGAHVSSAGGVHNAPTNCVHIGGNAFALFLKSQRKWENPPLTDDVASLFRGKCKDHQYDQAAHVVPHGSYLVNLANTSPVQSEQAYGAFLDDLKRCERLGIKLYNFHPGNNRGSDRPKAIQHLAQQLNRAHKETSTVITLLENMAAGGNVLGSTFEELRDVIAQVEDKSRVGVCIDTCHAFAAGYDLRSSSAFKATMDQFEKVVGFGYLKAMHINDSKAPFNSHRDLHANIGTGHLGLRAFHNIVNEPRFEGLPLVLETPLDVTDAVGEPIKDDKGKTKEDKQIWAKEIKLLESLVGMDPECDEFLRLEEDLAKKGASERKKFNEQFERKKAKDEKKNRAGKKRASKAANDSSELSDSD